MSEPTDPTAGATPFRAILFDVNETLLDLGALDPIFAAAFGDAAVRRTWFAEALRLAFVSTLVGRPPDFAEIGRAALATIAGLRGVACDDRLADAAAEGMRALPPHPDVPAALTRLRNAGITLAALSNNPPAVLRAQLDQAGLAGRFDLALSAAESGRLKPAPEPYRLALARLGLPPERVLFVAAHGWDLAGAAAVGLPIAFIARLGQSLDPLAPPPVVDVPDLRALADTVVGRDPS